MQVAGWKFVEVISLVSFFSNTMESKELGKRRQEEVLDFFFFETEFRSCYPGCSAMERSWLTATSASWAQAILLPQPPE